MPVGSIDFFHATIGNVDKSYSPGYKFIHLFYSSQKPFEQGMIHTESQARLNLDDQEISGRKLFCLRLVGATQAAPGIPETASFSLSTGCQ